jgi:acyl-CoA dehydrogenase
MFSFSSPQPDAELALAVRKFVESIIPYEKDPRNTAHGPTDALRRELNALAREAGLLAPQVATQYGGRALSHVQRAIVFEAAGYSPLGPIALHCAAPDEGNMHLLEAVANEEQKEKYLRPLATAEVRSCFAMTEPAPGAGSDPSLLRTVATGDGNTFRVSGKKWLITGADGAAFMILMARTLIDGKDEGATMFLVDLPNPAVRIERLIDSLDSSFTQGHAVVDIDNLEVGKDDVLGEIGKGFRYAQVRLAPARLTHCMRWIGAAQRAHDIAVAHARTRPAFGKPIGQHQAVGFSLADNEMDLHVARLVTLHAAWTLDQGHRGSAESSRAKVIVSEALFRVADRCLQILGGLGLTGDTVVAQIFRELRAFRIYDGPSETHRWALARRIVSPDKTIEKRNGDAA